MISFRKLGEWGRFGNQLFQYAYLRSQAGRMGVKFYCPKWRGDSVFELQDEKERGEIFDPKFYYNESEFNHGFDKKTLDIKDETDVTGFFQSEKFFSKSDIREWFSFKKEMFEGVRKKYSNIDFKNSIAIHLRLGDYLNPSLQFYIAKTSYFEEALNLLGSSPHILVFSDDPNRAQKSLGHISGNIQFIEGNKDYEDFYLITKCRDVICSASSFSWWAAYLNPSSTKKVIMPSQWFLPGSPTANHDIFVSEWITLPAHHWFDHYYVRYIPVKARGFYRRLSNFLLPSKTS